jgi:hypothetical protein
LIFWPTLDAPKRHGRGLESLEPEHRPEALLYSPVVWLHHIMVKFQQRYEKRHVRFWGLNSHRIPQLLVGKVVLAQQVDVLPRHPGEAVRMLDLFELALNRLAQFHLIDVAIGRNAPGLAQGAFWARRGS